MQCLKRSLLSLICRTVDVISSVLSIRYFASSTEQPDGRATNVPGGVPQPLPGAHRLPLVPQQVRPLRGEAENHTFR